MNTCWHVKVLKSLFILLSTFKNIVISGLMQNSDQLNNCTVLCIVGLVLMKGVKWVVCLAFWLLHLD